MTFNGLTVRTARLFIFLLGVVLIHPVAGQAAEVIGTNSFTTGWATFGQAVPPGKAVTALQVGSLPTQTDVKTRWPDNSIRFAIVTANIPSNGAYAITSGDANPGTFT